MNDDLMLLREFGRRNSDEAFAALVSRYVNLVYSVALRSVRNPHLAEEITQAVFIILARKADSLGDKIILSGWLCRTARYASANALTIQRRRNQREQEAFMQNILSETANESALDETWKQISPLLDVAMEKLAKKDHDALALRFFENKTFAEVGATLGASEDAAKMRVNRALEKLRKFFTKRGVSSTTAIIAGTISANSVQAAPVVLAKAVTATAFVKGAAASGSALALAKGTLKIMTYAKLKLAAGIGVAVLLASGTITMIVAQTETNSGVDLASDSMLIVPGQSVGRIQKGMTAEQVQAVLGKSESLPLSYNMNYSGKFGFNVLIAGKNGVAEVLCRRAFHSLFRGHTKEGIGMESSRDDVIKAYGAPTSDTTENGVEILNYEPLQLTFFFEKGKVTTMIIAFAPRVSQPAFEGLSMRTYKPNAEIFTGNLRRIEVASNNEPVQQLVLRYFKDNGIETNASLTVFWNDRRSELYVRCKVSDQDKIEKLVVKLNDSQKN